MHVEFGDNGRYNATGIGTITFNRESGKLILLQDVVHDLGLKKNLISVSMLEDKGYEVVFSVLTGKFVQPTVGDLPGRKSQLDLKPFGVGIPPGCGSGYRLRCIPFWSQKNLIKPADTHLFIGYEIHD